jgi:hypothetical protein
LILGTCDGPSAYFVHAPAEACRQLSEQIRLCARMVPQDLKGFGSIDTAPVPERF